VKAVRPISVSTTVEAPPSRVFEFLVVLANHEQFLDHFLVDWEFSGPASGVGAKARARQNAPGGQDRTEFELIEVDDGRRLVEDGLGAKDKHGTHNRHTVGTYTLTEAAGGGTKIEFELEWLEASRAERMIPPMTRAFTRRSLAKGMRRLKKALAPN
jgi:uncharacterized protein YndB with AHSA1/START domain